MNGAWHWYGKPPRFSYAKHRGTTVRRVQAWPRWREAAKRRNIACHGGFFKPAKIWEKTKGRAIYLYVEGWVLYTWCPFVAFKCNFMYIYIYIKKSLGSVGYPIFKKKMGWNVQCVGLWVNIVDVYMSSISIIHKSKPSCWCSNPTLLLICSSFASKNSYPGCSLAHIQQR